MVSTARGLRRSGWIPGPVGGQSGYGGLAGGAGVAGRIGLAEAIERLRWELGQAQDVGADQQLRFEVAEVELELLVELRKEGSAKVSFGVVPVGVDGAVSSGSTHRLKLKLNVKDEALGGRTLEVTDDAERSFDR